MCGILGWIHKRPLGSIELDAFSTALEELNQRGPDGKGITQPSPHCLLGHTRLAIVDVSELGRQPIANERGDVFAVVNGEIYNHYELKTQLEALGHRFRSQTDSEVIVHAWEAWGEDLLQHLRGIFAFAVYDTRQDLLFLARDPAGVKPLYFWESEAGFAFASRIDAIASLPGFSRDVDEKAFFAFLAHRFIPHDLAIYRGARKLLPGHSLSKTKEKAPSIRRYWAPTILEAPDNPESYPLELAADLESTVQSQLMSDVPVGVLLSGGIDSSIIAAISAKHTQGTLPGFVCGFMQTSHDERPQARLSAAATGVNLFETLMDWPELAARIPDFLSWHDGPFFDYSAIAINALCVRARAEGCKVLLSGDGADELFSGYLWYDDFANQTFSSQHEALSCYFKYNGFFTADELTKLRGRPSPYDPIKLLGQLDDPSLPRVTRAQLLDFQTFLVDDVLAKVDGASMAAGVEVRVPFLDQTLLRKHFLLPPKIHYKGNQRKATLKKAAQNWLPASILTNRKKGFGFPLESWSSPIRQLATRAFSDNCASAQRGFLLPAAVQEAIQQGNIHQTWLLLMAELWLRKESDPEALRDWLAINANQRPQTDSRDAKAWHERVLVIVRTCGEATTDLCCSLVEGEGIPPQSLRRLGHMPFPQTLRESLQVGLAEQREWTLCLDADVLPLPGRIKALLREAEALDPETFELQPVVFDRLFGSWRPAGVHLYRTLHLQRAIETYATLPDSIRPETQLIEAMATLGYPWKQSSLSFGLHDFLQEPQDIYRKAYVHAQKHDYFIPKLEDYWTVMESEPDFAAALKGLQAGSADSTPIPLDKNHPAFRNAFPAGSEPDLDTTSKHFNGDTVEALLKEEIARQQERGYTGPPVWDWAQSQLASAEEDQREPQALVLHILEKAVYQCRIERNTPRLRLFRRIAAAHALAIVDEASEPGLPHALVDANEEQLLSPELGWPTKHQPKAKLPPESHPELNDAIENLARRVAKTGARSILVYGAGEGGRALTEALRSHGISVPAYLQSDTPCSEYIRDTPCYQFSQGISKHRALPIAIASLTHRTEIAYTLVSHLRRHASPVPIFALSNSPQ